MIFDQPSGSSSKAKKKSKAVNGHNSAAGHSKSESHLPGAALLRDTDDQKVFRVKLVQACSQLMKQLKKEKSKVKSLNSLLASKFKLNPSFSLLVADCKTLLKNIVDALKRHHDDDILELNEQYVEDISDMLKLIFRHVDTLLGFSFTKTKHLNAADDTEFIFTIYRSLCMGLNQLRAFLKGSIVFNDSEFNFCAKYTCVIPEAEAFWITTYGNVFFVDIDDFSHTFIRNGPVSKCTIQNKASSSLVLGLVNMCRRPNYISKFDFDRFTILFRPFHAIGEVVHNLLSFPFGFSPEEPPNTDFRNYLGSKKGTYVLCQNHYKNFAYWTIHLHDTSGRWVSCEISPFKNAIDFFTGQELYRYPKNEKISEMALILRSAITIPHAKHITSQRSCHCCRKNPSAYRIEPCLHAICIICVKRIEVEEIYLCPNCNRVILSSTCLITEVLQDEDINKTNMPKKSHSSFDLSNFKAPLAYAEIDEDKMDRFQKSVRIMTDSSPKHTVYERIKANNIRSLKPLSESYTQNMAGIESSSKPARNTQILNMDEFRETFKFD